MKEVKEYYEVECLQDEQNLLEKVEQKENEIKLEIEEQNLSDMIIENQNDTCVCKEEERGDVMEQEHKKK